MPRTDVDKVADYFIYTAHIVGDCITNLQLQKLVYYAEAWHLAIYDEPLTGADFEAWIHGPVVPSLYRRFRQHRWDPISDPVEDPGLDPDIQEHLNEVLDAYSRFSAWDLERMTHNEQPWQSARVGLDPDEPSDRVISPEEMKRFYRSLSEEVDGAEAR